jgi:hypothetical protein
MKRSIVKRAENFWDNIPSDLFKITFWERIRLFFRPMHVAKNVYVDLYYKYLNGTMYIIREVIHDDKNYT